MRQGPCSFCLVLAVTAPGDPRVPRTDATAIAAPESPRGHRPGLQPRARASRVQDTLPLRNRPCLGRPLLILCVVAFPDTDRVDYTVLLPNVLANLPADDEVNNYRIGLLGVFSADGGERKAVPSATPSWKCTLNAGVYNSTTGGLWWVGDRE